MKFTAVVDRILPHERLVGTGVRETYKNVVHLVVTDKDGVITAQQPQSEVAGFMELHIPADVEWDAAEPGLLVSVDITVKKAKDAPSTSKSPSARKSGSSTRSSTSRSSGKSTRKKSPAKARSRASSTGSTASRPGKQRTAKAKSVTREPSDQTSPTTAP